MGEVTLGLFHEPPPSRPMVLHKQGWGYSLVFSYWDKIQRQKQTQGAGRLISAPTLRVHRGEEVKAGGA